MKKINIRKIAFICSALFLTFLLTLNFSVIIDYSKYTGEGYYIKPWYSLLAVIISIPFYMYLCPLVNKSMRAYWQENKLSVVIAIIYTVCIWNKLLADTKQNSDAIQRAFIKTDSARVDTIWIPIICCLCIFAVFVISLHVISRFFIFVKTIVTNMDKIEYIFLLVYCLAGLVMIICFYSKVNGQWASVDLVYQMDSGFMFYHYYPVFSFGFDFDWDIGNGGIRHPLATLFSYSIHLVTIIPVSVLRMVRNIKGIMYAVCQTVMIAFSGILLERITKNKWTLVIYGISFPSVFFCIFLEKYPLAVLFLLIFVVMTLRDENNGLALVAAGGVTITSCFLGFFYGKSHNLVSRVKEWIHIFFVFFATIVAAGRIHYIIDYSYLSNQNNICFFKVKDISIIERLTSFSNLIISCFIPIKSEVISGQYFWSDMQTKFNWVGYLIILLLAYTIAFYWKDRRIQILGCWLLWAFIQVVVTGFSSDASCVFCYYFSWAVIGICMIGIDNLIHNTKIKNIFYLGLASVVLVMDISQMNQIFQYLLQTTPIS